MKVTHLRKPINSFLDRHAPCAAAVLLCFLGVLFYSLYFLTDWGNRDATWHTKGWLLSFFYFGAWIPFFNLRRGQVGRFGPLQLTLTTLMAINIFLPFVLGLCSLVALSVFFVNLIRISPVLSLLFTCMIVYSAPQDSSMRFGSVCTVNYVLLTLAAIAVVSVFILTFF